MQEKSRKRRRAIIISAFSKQDTKACTSALADSAGRINMNKGNLMTIIIGEAASGPIKSLHQCANQECTGRYKKIKEYYSFRHARDNGWNFTTHEKYCDPEIAKKGGHAAVCPSCSKKHGWVKEEK